MFDARIISQITETPGENIGEAVRERSLPSSVLVGVPKKLHESINSAVDDLLYDAAQAAMTALENLSGVFAERLNEYFERSEDTQVWLAQCLADQLRHAPDETRRRVFEILSDELARTPR